VHRPFAPRGSWDESERISEGQAGVSATLKTFVEMEKWLTDNGFAIVKVED